MHALVTEGLYPGGMPTSQAQSQAAHEGDPSTLQRSACATRVKSSATSWSGFWGIAEAGCMQASLCVCRASDYAFQVLYHIVCTNTRAAPWHWELYFLWSRCWWSGWSCCQHPAAWHHMQEMSEPILYSISDEGALVHAITCEIFQHSCMLSVDLLSSSHRINESECIQSRPEFWFWHCNQCCSILEYLAGNWTS